MQGINQWQGCVMKCDLPTLTIFNRIKARHIMLLHGFILHSPSSLYRYYFFNSLTWGNLLSRQSARSMPRQNWSSTAFLFQSIVTSDPPPPTSSSSVLSLLLLFAFFQCRVHQNIGLGSSEALLTSSCSNARIQTCPLFVSICTRNTHPVFFCVCVCARLWCSHSHASNRNNPLICVSQQGCNLKSLPSRCFRLLSENPQCFQVFHLRVELLYFVILPCV